MAGEIKRLLFSDGTTVTAPSELKIINTSNLAQFANDAAYETDKGSFPAGGDIYYNTTSNVIRYNNGSGWGSLIDESTAQTLSSKTIDNAATVSIGATVDTSSIFDTVSTTKGTRPAPSMTQAQRDAISTPATGLQVFNTDVNQVQVYNGTAWSDLGGGGSGEKNYISNGDAEDTSTTGWEEYDDGASATPVDGTGSTAANLALTAQNTVKLSGDYSFKLAKSAADAQGEGISYDFTIDKEDQNKLLKIQFPFNTDGTYTDGNIAVYIYDVTNASLITPSVTAINGYDKDNVGSSRFQAGWVSTDSLSYRLIFHITATDTDAYDFYFDNVVVGPGNVVTGAIVEETKSITGFTSNWTNSSISGFVTRKGDKADFDLKLLMSGTPTGGALIVTLPSGYTIDSTKLADTTAAVNATLGTATYRDVGAATYIDLHLAYDTTTTFRVSYEAGGSTYTNVTDTTPVAVPISGDFIVMRLRDVPIAEWAGSGVTNLGANDVEYASNNGTGTTDDDTTTNVVAGPAGAAIGFSSTPAGNEFRRRVSFQSNIQSTDTIKLQISADGNTWIDFLGGKFETGVSSRDIAAKYYDGTNYIGMGLSLDDDYTDSVFVTFGKYRVASTTAWDSITALLYYRVIKHKSGIPVGFGLANATNSGLVTSYETQTITLDNNFTAGTMKITKIGNLVTASVYGIAWSSTLADIASSTGLIPSNMRPNTDVHYFTESDVSGPSAYMAKVLFKADGQFRLLLRSATDLSNSIAARVSTDFDGTQYTISWVV